MKHRWSRSLAVAALFAALALLVAPQTASAYDCSGSPFWLAAANGNWTTSTSWWCSYNNYNWWWPNPGQYPGAPNSNTNTNVRIWNNYSITLNTNATIGSLHLDDGLLLMNGNLTVRGSVTIDPYETVRGGGTGTRQLAIGGDLSNRGHLELYLNSGANTVDLIFNGSSNQSISGDAQFFGGKWHLHNVTIANTTRSVTINTYPAALIYGTLTVNSGASLVVTPGTYQVRANTVTNNGTLRQTMSIGTGTTQVLRFFNAAGTAYTYFGVDVMSGAASLGNTTVEISGNQTCTEALGFPVKRCYRITPQFQVARDIRFFFAQPEMQPTHTLPNLNIWNYHNSSWNAITRGGDSGTCTAGAINCYVQGNNISAYSPFVVKEFIPTGVTLADFSAAQQEDAVLVTWETVSELNNRGYHLWRGSTPLEPDRQLNSGLIPSQSQGSPSGFLYSWSDDVDLVAGSTYYYWLEDVATDGAVTRHGPVSLLYVSDPTAVTLRSSDTRSADGAVWLMVSLALAAGSLALRRGRARGPVQIGR